MPIVPTPAAARYMLDGEPSPPAPMHSTLRLEQLDLPGHADLGQHGVPRVARLLIAAQRERLLPREARCASTP